MGIAEVIPGVSGGTIAFITGIYEKLIDSIKAVGPELIRGYKTAGIKGAWNAINGGFLAALGAGMIIGLLSGVMGITYLIEHYPPAIWAFFFGLIVSSAIYIFRQISSFKAMEFIAIAVGFGIAYYVTIATPAHGSESLLMVFISGAIAISAMILPGVSGSFILLLMGMYMIVLPAVEKAVKHFDPAAIKTVLVFISGCIVGLAIFSRVISWVFKHHKNVALALLTGFMIGSLNKLWPWRNVIQTRINSKGEEVPFLENNVLPAAYEGNPMVITAVITLIAGLAVVFVLDYFGKKEEVV